MQQLLFRIQEGLPNMMSPGYSLGQVISHLMTGAGTKYIKSLFRLQ